MGIGEGAVLVLAGAGVLVAVARRRQDRFESLVARIEAARGTALALPGDVSVEEQARKLVEDMVARFGRIGILI